MVNSSNNHRRVGVALDNLFCNTNEAKGEWGQKDPTLSFTKDNPFWASLVPYEDITELVAWLQDKDFYIFAERPLNLMPVTRGWLRSRCGLVVTKEQLVMQAIPRYDCRLREIQVFIGPDPAVIENLKVETVSPVQGYLLNREQGRGLKELMEEIDV